MVLSGAAKKRKAEKKKQTQIRQKQRKAGGDEKPVTSNADLVPRTSGDEEEATEFVIPDLPFNQGMRFFEEEHGVGTQQKPRYRFLIAKCGTGRPRVRQNSPKSSTGLRRSRTSFGEGP